MHIESFHLLSVGSPPTNNFRISSVVGGVLSSVLAAFFKRLPLSLLLPPPVAGTSDELFMRTAIPVPCCGLELSLVKRWGDDMLSYGFETVLQRRPRVCHRSLINL